MVRGVLLVLILHRVLARARDAQKLAVLQVGVLIRRGVAARGLAELDPAGIGRLVLSAACPRIASLLASSREMIASLSGPVSSGTATTCSRVSESRGARQATVTVCTSTAIILIMKMKMI